MNKNSLNEKVLLAIQKYGILQLFCDFLQCPTDFSKKVLEKDTKMTFFVFGSGMGLLFSSLISLVVFLAISSDKIPLGFLVLLFFGCLIIFIVWRFVVRNKQLEKRLKHEGWRKFFFEEIERLLKDWDKDEEGINNGTDLLKFAYTLPQLLQLTNTVFAISCLQEIEKIGQDFLSIFKRYDLRLFLGHFSIDGTEIAANKLYSAWGGYEESSVFPSAKKIVTNTKEILRSIYKEKIKEEEQKYQKCTELYKRKIAELQ